MHLQYYFQLVRSFCVSQSSFSSFICQQVWKAGVLYNFAFKSLIILSNDTNGLKPSFESGLLVKLLV